MAYNCVVGAYTMRAIRLSTAKRTQHNRRLRSHFYVFTARCFYIALTTADVIAHLTRLSSCLSVLHNWFCLNGLVLNSSKSESILFGTRQRLRNFPLVSTPTIAGSQIPSPITL